MLVGVYVASDVNIKSDIDMSAKSLVVKEFVYFFKHKTAYEMRNSDWSSDGCSSDLPLPSRALAIIFSSSSSSSPVISSCIPSSAAAALVADPLKKTRTTWLSADLRAVLSDTLGA